jgi:hypothetical protein
VSTASAIFYEAFQVGSFEVLVRIRFVVSGLRPFEGLYDSPVRYIPTRSSPFVIPRYFNG